MIKIKNPGRDHRMIKNPGRDHWMIKNPGRDHQMIKNPESSLLRFKTNWLLGLNKVIIG